MAHLNLNPEESAAIVGWNGQGLAGYAVHERDFWLCIAHDPIGDTRRTCRSSATAMHWLKQTASAAHFETLVDQEELAQLIEANPSHGGPRSLHT